jgi:glycosyltransferase involved in cell wall biosynthesis
MTINIDAIYTYYPHWSKHSGYPQFIRHINQSRYNINLQAVADNDSEFPIKNITVRDITRYLVQKRGMRWYKLSDLMGEWRELARCRHGQVDIIHYLEGEHSTQFLPPLLKKTRRVRPKVIATYHQPPELLDSLVIKPVVKQLDAIIVLSPEQALYFEKIVAPDKVHLILHGTNTNFFTPGTLAAGNGKFKCITVGNWLRDYYTVGQVAQKLIDYPDIEFLVVSSNARQVEGLPNVKVYKGISDEELLTLYQQANVLFLPLLQSTANNTLLEGIACGLPVLSTALESVETYVPGNEAIFVKNTGPIRQVSAEAYLTDKQAVFVNHNDPDQFAEAILNLVHNPAKRTEMAIAARERAKQLDWRNIALQYEAIYSKLAGNLGGDLG